MNCYDQNEWITRYAAGELDGEMKVELENHLVDCPTCREELALATRLEALLEGGSPAASPAGLVDRIMIAVDREEQESLEREVVSIAHARRFLMPRNAFLPVLTCALAVVFISIGLSIGWPFLYENLSMMFQGLSEAKVGLPISTPEGGVVENLNLLITGFMVLVSLCFFLSYMFPVRIRWREIVGPF